MITIKLNKFGTVLSSRQSGREAYLAISGMLDSLTEDEQVVLDFDGVISFSPSWGGEFLLSLKERLRERLVLLKTENPSAIATLDILKRAHGVEFKIV